MADQNLALFWAGFEPQPNGFTKFRNVNSTSEINTLKDIKNITTSVIDTETELVSQNETKNESIKKYEKDVL